MIFKLAIWLRVPPYKCLLLLGVLLSAGPATAFFHETIMAVAQSFLSCFSGCSCHCRHEEDIPLPVLDNAVQHNMTIDGVNYTVSIPAVGDTQSKSLESQQTLASFVSDRKELIEESGTSSWVYKVTTDNGVFAIKQPKETRYRQTLQYEALQLCSLENPFVLSLHSWAESEADTLLIFEHFKTDLWGTLLEDEKDNPASYSVVLSRARMLINGLACIHEAGFIHKDIKAENILVRENGSLVIADLGSLTKTVRERRRSRQPRRVALDAGIYAAPEVQSRTVFNHTAVDIWGFGIILCLMIKPDEISELIHQNGQKTGGGLAVHEHINQYISDTVISEWSNYLQLSSDEIRGRAPLPEATAWLPLSEEAFIYGIINACLRLHYQSRPSATTLKALFEAYTEYKAGAGFTG